MAELRVDGLSLDHLAVFVAVVDAGSFSAAARKLNRAQSVVTYAIQALEQHTGSELFDRTAYRPTLTKEGAVLLPRARRVLDAALEFRTQAHGLTAGIESRLALAVDVGVPMTPFVAHLRDFQEEYPMVEVSIMRQPLQATIATLKNGLADLGVVGDPPGRQGEDDFLRRRYGRARMVAVAAIDHPLGKIDGIIDENRLRDFMQVMLSSDIGSSGTDDAMAFAINRWRVNDISLRYSIIIAGLGWASMPLHMEEDDIAAGRLVALKLYDRDPFTTWPEIALSVVHLKTKVLGPAGQWLAEHLTSIKNI
ncbi:LysR family transcriptional regulator [Devosia submarina]|uniref:LysR family transcriptional regulator n=1 Tax=Devosia submarina TaxID=1173082 RepID=UPI0014739BF8|nr:LysR family transcriptional regulator [Devosia submarina]